MFLRARATGDRIARSSRKRDHSRKSRDPRSHVYVRFGCKSHEVSIAVKDEGRGFDLNKMPDPTAPENIGSVRGRGIYLMKALMDEVRFEEGGVVVHMRKSTGHATAKDAQNNPPE